MKFDAFIGGSYESQAFTADQEDCINWYAEVLQSDGATARTVLYPTPGVQTLSVNAAGAGRAHFSMNAREFAVIGTKLWEVDQFGVLTDRTGAVTNLAIDANPATICSSGDLSDELFITSGGNGYVFNLGTNTLTQIAALNGLADQGDYLEGYFLALDLSTSTLYISALGDGTTWTTGTDFAQRSLAPDPWKGMKVVGRYIWLLGEYTGEVWHNVGATFPFAPIQGALIPYGTAASFSLATVGNGIAWLAKSKAGAVRIVYAEGLTPRTISTYAVSSAIQDYEFYNQPASTIHVTGDSYSDRGHTFYLLHFDDDDVTWCWDLETGLWHKRGTWLTEESSYMVWRPRWHVVAFRENRVLDSHLGYVYRLSTDLATDVAGRAIRRVRRAPAIMNEDKRVYYSSFELDLEPGVGAASGSTNQMNPQVMLRLSNDGGKTWVSEEWRAAGATGEYSQRVRWNRLGQARRRVFEVSVTDPVPWRLTGAYLKSYSV